MLTPETKTPAYLRGPGFEDPDNPNKVYSRETLLEYVWGNKAMVNGDVRTVDVHVRRLREKIEPSPSDPKYVHTKWGVGYFFRA